MNKDIKIGIICHMGRNIGNNLTNYALWQYLTDLGYQAALIDAPMGVPWISLRYPRNKTRLFLVNPFPEDALEADYGKDEISDLNDTYDFFIVGSDQLFRNNFLQGLEYHTCMKWMRDDKYKVAYATSFGTDKFEGSVADKLKLEFYLGRFHRLSVREKSGQNMLKAEFGLDAEWVLDPVFLCEKIHYEAMAELGKARLPKNNYVFAYILDVDEKKEKIIRQASDILSSGNYISILSRQLIDEDGYEGSLNTLLFAKAEEWLAGIRECDFFVTDSFHGVCFALIFHKQFCLVFDKENWRGWSRFESILSVLDLADRVVENIDSFNEKCFESNQIDYEKIDSILLQLRAESEAWITRSIEEAGRFRGKLSAHDMLIDMQLAYKKSHDSHQNAFEADVIRQLRKIKSDIFLMRHYNKKPNAVCRRRASDMEVIAWGSGGCFERNYEAISKLYPLQYVCDNSPEKWGKRFYDKVLCISPKQISEMTDVLVIITVDDVGLSFQIANQLIDMGIMNFDHVENWLNQVFDQKYNNQQ